MMRHLKPFNESEDDLIGDLDKIGIETMKGWILVLQTWHQDGIENYFYLCITAPNIYSAVEQMMAAVGEEDMEIEPEEIDENGFEIIQKIAEENYDERGTMIVCSWEGLIPRGRTTSNEAIFEANPYVIIKELESQFTNVSQVLGQSPNGNI